MAAGKTQHVRRFYHYTIKIVWEGDKPVLVVYDPSTPRFVRAVAKKFGVELDSYGYKFTLPLTARTMYRSLRTAHKAVEEEKRKDDASRVDGSGP